MPLLDHMRKPRLFRATALAAALAVTATSMPQPVHAQVRDRLAPVRDAEIEDLMRDYTTPLLRAAGLVPSDVKITLINDFSFNAFVANGQRIFINLGAIVDSKKPNQLIGVLAHETGHIAGGHLAAMRERLDAAGTRAIIAMLLGAAAVAGAAAAGAGGNSIAGGASMAATAPQEMIKRDLLGYIRAQEQAADQAGISYLTKTGQSGRGMLETFKGFAEKSMFSQRFIDPYAQTHPMPQERIALLERLVNASPTSNAEDSPAFIHRHAMARAKIIAFMRAPDVVARHYPASNTSLPARYARAVSAARFGNINDSQKQIDTLIAAEPDNPYFWELKGQMLLEAGRAKQAIEPLRRASRLAPKSGLIRMLLGEALVATNDPALLDQALTELRQAIAREREAPKAYRNLATAYGRKGMLAQADAASAQSYFYAGDVTTAKQLAARAKSQLKVGSPDWLRADDIVNYRIPGKK